MPVPDTIVCVDCGGVCHRLTGRPELGWDEGDVASFRCVDCLDRWDVVLEPDDVFDDERPDDDLPGGVGDERRP